MTPLAAFLVLTVTLQTAAERTSGNTPPDPLSALSVLEGTWQGEGEGFGRQEKFLRFRQFLSEGFVNSYRVEAVVKNARGYNFDPNRLRAIRQWPRG